MEKLHSVEITSDNNEEGASLLSGIMICLVELCQVGHSCNCCRFACLSRVAFANEMQLSWTRENRRNVKSFKFDRYPLPLSPSQSFFPLSFFFLYNIYIHLYLFSISLFLHSGSSHIRLLHCRNQIIEVFYMTHGIKVQFFGQIFIRKSTKTAYVFVQVHPTKKCFTAQYTLLVLSFSFLPLSSVSKRDKKNIFFICIYNIYMHLVFQKHFVDRNHFRLITLTILCYAKLSGDVFIGFGSRNVTRMQTMKKQAIPRKAARHWKSRSAEKMRFPNMTPKFPEDVMILTLVPLNGIGITSAFTAVTILLAILDVTITAAANVSI